jgi:hypothetical protein
MFLMLCGFFLKNRFSDSLLTTDYDIQIVVADKIKNKTIFKRLGFVLSKIKPQEAHWIACCKERLSQGYSQLDSTSKGKRLIKKWRLWIPEGLYD